MTENNLFKKYDTTIENSEFQNSDNQINNDKSKIEQMIFDLNTIKSGIENFKNNESLKQFFNAEVKNIFETENIDWNVLQNQLKKLDFKIEISNKIAQTPHKFYSNVNINDIIDRKAQLKLAANRTLQIKENIRDPQDLLIYKNEIKTLQNQILNLEQQENEFYLKKAEVNENFNNNFELIQQWKTYKSQFQKFLQQKLSLERKLKKVNAYANTNLLREFIITNITYVKDFIINDVNPVIVPIISEKYFNAEINKDYTIEIVNLKQNDILYDHELVILVKSLNTIDMDDEMYFNIKIKYAYDKETHIEVVDAIFKPAISKKFWKNRGNSYYKNIVWSAPTYEKVSEDIKTAKPLDWLLNEPHLPFKIAVELIAASKWTTFFWKWWAVKKNSGEPGGAWAVSAYSVIPNEGLNTSIRYVENLFKLDNIYFNKIFMIIEQKLRSLNINCQVKKKTVKFHNNCDDFAFAVGFLNFDDSENRITDNKKDSQYYIAVNFDVIFENNITREYAGVIFFLSDELKLYS